MQPLAFFCKTFRDDFDRLERMLQSYRRFNADAIPLALSLPEQDVDLYRARFAAWRLPVFLDHELTGFHQPPGNAGWTYQQVVKLCCDQTAMAETYFMVDSDFYFIRRFGRADFLDADGAPFLFLSPHGHYADGGPMFDDVLGYISGEAAREFASDALATLRSGRVPDFSDLEALRPLCRDTDLSAAFGHPPITYYCQSGPLLRAEVLRAMRGGASDGSGVMAARLVGLAPWEVNWHSEFLFASDRTLTIRPMQVFHVASEAGLEQVRRAGITERQVAARYLAIAMAARHLGAMALTG